MLYQLLLYGPHILRNLKIFAVEQDKHFIFQFEKLPPEIRLMICRLSLDCHGDELLAALRPCPDLYKEALGVFYSIWGLLLDIDTYRRFNALKEETLLYIESLRLFASQVMITTFSSFPY